MRDDKILRAIGNIDEDLIERAGSVTPSAKAVRVKFAPWFRWAVPVAACLVIVIAIAVPTLLQQSPMVGGGYTSGTGNAEYDGESVVPEGGNGNDSLEGSASGGAIVPKPGVSIDGGVESAACYAALEDWHGLPTTNHVLDEKTGGITADRMVFRTLEELALYADAFVLVPSVHETSQDGDNMQTSIAEYAETIGDRLNTRQWDDYTVSTGNRVLIRQRLIGGCTMDEPNNLIREGGVYLLPIKFNSDWGAYEVVGDLDVLFELNDEGKIVSHSQWEGLSQYDGKSLLELVDDVRALYPALDIEFTEQSINTVEQAINQVTTAYNASGYRKFSVEFDSETIISGADVYLFKVSFGGKDSEYAAIAKENGAFIRGERPLDGDMRTYGGLGSFPW